MEIDLKIYFVCRPWLVIFFRYSKNEVTYPEISEVVQIQLFFLYISSLALFRHLIERIMPIEIICVRNKTGNIMFTFKAKRA